MRKNALLGMVFLTFFVVAASACGNDPAKELGGGSGGDGEAGSGGSGGSGGAGGTGGEAVRLEFTRITPESGPPGTEIRLEGRGFNPVASRNTLRFTGGAESSPTTGSSDGTWLVGRVPTGAKSGPVTVLVERTEGIVRVDGPTFSVTEVERPEILSLTPAIGYVGVRTHHSLVGTGFGSGCTVEIDGRRAEWRVIAEGDLEVTIADNFGLQKGSHDVVVRTLGGVASEPATLSVDDPLDLVAVQPSSDTEVLLRFSHPAPDPDLVRAVSLIWPTVRILGVETVPSRPELLKVVAEPIARGEYQLHLSPILKNAEGRPLRWSDRAFQSFGSEPLSLGYTTATGCGARGLASGGAVSVIGTEVAVAEELGNQFQLLKEDGTFGAFVGSDGTSFGLHEGDATASGCPGAEGDAGGLLAPRGALVSDGSANLWMADTGHGRILHFARIPGVSTADEVYSGAVKPVLLGLVAGRLLVATGADELLQVDPGTGSAERIGSGGTGAAQYRFGIEEGFSPAADTLDSGVLLIAEPANHRIQASSDGTGLGWIGGGNDHFSTDGACCSAGNRAGYLTAPACVAVDLAGGFWVADRAGANGRLLRFFADGTLHFSKELGFVPAGCAIDRQNELFVSADDPAYVWRFRL